MVSSQRVEFSPIRFSFGHCSRDFERQGNQRETGGPQQTSIRVNRRNTSNEIKARSCRLKDETSMDTSMSEDRGAYKEAWGLNIQWDLPMNKAMFQYTVALGLCVLVLIVLGAVYTSEIQRMPGSNAPAVTASTAGEMSLELAHSVAGWIV